MAGIYIHIPFCKQKCHYCDFHFSTTFESYYDEMVSAIAQDIQKNSLYLKGEVVETLYFGGGTPSLLLTKDLAFLIDEVKKNFNCDIQELTLEMNPDDMEDSYLQELKSIGINRLSIGIQSFDDKVLSFMNRAHNANEAINCVDRAKAAGINNISIDLIYGIPNVTKEYWKDTVQKALSLGVQHISAYCLTIEENTAFSQMVKKGVFKTIPLDEKWRINTDVVYQLRRSKIIDHKLYFSYLNVNPSIQHRVSEEFILISGINIGILLNALEVYDKFLDDPGGPLGIITITRNRNKYHKTLDLQWSTGMEVKFSQSFGAELKGAVSLFDLNSKYDKAPGIIYTVFKYWSISLSAKYYFK